MEKKETRTEYYARTTKQYGVQFRRGADADIIQKLDNVPSKIDYLRNLIRADIEKQKAMEGRH